MTRVVALLLTVLTGFSALVYQVAWQKHLASLLGSHSEATAAVLGIFLGGLACGYALFGKLSRRIAAHSGESASRNLLSAYAAVEIGIGLYALAFPWLFAETRALSLWLPQGSEGMGFTLDVLLTAGLIGPPTVLMGGTIPLLTQGLARNLENATRFHSLVYAFNTAGAFGGALCAGFFLIPALGLDGSVLAMGVINLLAGGSFALLSRTIGSVVPSQQPEAESADGPSGVVALSLVALLAGFAMMTLQIVLNRLGALSLGASHFTFSMVVASFVFCIAAGSLVVSALPRIRTWYLALSQWALVLYLLALYPMLENAPYWAHLIRIEYESSAAGFHHYHFSVLLGMLAVLAVPLSLSGALLPLLFHHLRNQSLDLGRVAGKLYSWNTAGSLAGALLGGYALLFWLDLHEIYRLAVLALAVTATVLVAHTLPRARHARLAGAGALAAVVLALALAPPWSPEKLAAGLFRERAERAYSRAGADGFMEAHRAGRPADSLRFYHDDPTVSIAVIDMQQPGAPLRRSIVTNGKSDGNIPGDNLTTGMLALLPALFAERCERAFVIGYGTGMSVGELAALDSVKEVVVAEISQAVVDAAPLFETLNRHAFANPKTRLIRSDAYRALLRSGGSYDVIVSEPSNPWVNGVEMLYSREFLSAAKSRLSPGGVYAQWIHLYEIDDESVALVLRTYREVFPRVAVWSGKADDLILLGFADDRAYPSVERLEERFQRPDFSRQFRAFTISSFPRLLAHEVLPVGVVNSAELPGEIHTLSHPRLSDLAARAFFVGGKASLPHTQSGEAARVGASGSLVHHYRAAHGGTLPDPERLELLRQACKLGDELCSTLFAQWQLEAPESPALRLALSKLRAQPATARLVAPGVMDQLGMLFSDTATAALPASYEIAADVEDIFTRYYSHAAPFAPGALETPWHRCREDERCARRLEMSGWRSRVGPLASATPPLAR